MVNGTNLLPRWQCHREQNWPIRFDSDDWLLGEPVTRANKATKLQP